MMRTDLCRNDSSAVALHRTRLIRGSTRDYHLDTERVARGIKGLKTLRLKVIRSLTDRSSARGSSRTWIRLLSQLPVIRILEREPSRM